VNVPELYSVTFNAREKEVKKAVEDIAKRSCLN
jgi:hypothetical protein